MKEGGVKRRRGRGRNPSVGDNTNEKIKAGKIKV